MSTSWKFVLLAAIVAFFCATLAAASAEPGDIPEAAGDAPAAPDREVAEAIMRRLSDKCREEVETSLQVDGGESVSDECRAEFEGAVVAEQAARGGNPQAGADAADPSKSAFTTKMVTLLFVLTVFGGVAIYIWQHPEKWQKKYKPLSKKKELKARRKGR